MNKKCNRKKRNSDSLKIFPSPPKYVLTLATINEALQIRRKYVPTCALVNMKF